MIMALGPAELFQPEIVPSSLPNRKRAGWPPGNKNADVGLKTGPVGAEGGFALDWPVHAGDLTPGTLRSIERDLEPCLGPKWLTK